MIKIINFVMCILPQLNFKKERERESSSRGAGNFKSLVQGLLCATLILNFFKDLPNSPFAPAEHIWRIVTHNNLSYFSVI